MGRATGASDVNISELVPYERNAKQHSPEQVRKIADSIREFGFLSPILIDGAGNIIAGHGRVEAAKLLGMKSVPAVYIEGLTEAQRRAYILTDNRLTELGGWDLPLVDEELQNLAAMDFNIDLTGFELGGDWFTDRERYDNAGDYDQEYNDFIEKFEPKRTTDDCYTPDRVYTAVAEWVAKEYGVNRADMKRPFYPGGDYRNERYKRTDVVVDNPPFSILSEILTFYAENGVRFFLFGPTLTLFSSSSSETCCAIPCGAEVVYENGASVNTSFLTNLEPEELRVRTAPELCKAVQDASDEEQREKHAELPKYSYPDQVITAAMVARLSKYGIDFKLTKAESENISALDAQKETGKAIFGKGYLISERAAAERAAAERAAAERAAAERAAAQRWELSEREWQIVKNLGR
jgi:hypothetical protein